VVNETESTVNLEYKLVNHEMQSKKSQLSIAITIQSF